MRFSVASASLLASGATAFTDSSPFLIRSTSKLEVPSQSQIQSTSEVIATTRNLLSSCPTTNYLLLAQPNAHAADIRDPVTGACHAPSLCTSKITTASQFGVAEMVGPAIDPDELRAVIEEACQGKGMSVKHIPLEALPKEARVRGEVMRKTDEDVQYILQAVADDYTVIYFASPNEPPSTYESEYVESPVMPMELRRRSGGVLERRSFVVERDNLTDAPLFEKYQFFTPGLFMGFIAVLIMLAMLWAGLSAVASLQVSYGAFDKEMGPAAQKKQQ